MSFTALKLHASLLKGIKELGFVRPTPIQEEGIPLALAGRDLLACAMTGSGKTGAFLLPILHRLLDRPRGTTRALILTPTRELAAQILDDLNDFTVHTPLTGAAIFGGAPMGPQEHAFRSGVDVMIATPGRLLDHFRSAYAKLPGLEYLVLDEADRMLDMGFLPEIRKVLKQLPAKRQTLFFSATMPEPIAALSREMLHDPASINLQRKAAPAVGITQAVYPVLQSMKSSLLTHILETGEIDDALVFTRTKHRADRLARFLVKAGIKADRIHGDRSQPQRTAALAGFKKGKLRVLVATDIVARGIDVEALGHVVNFDVPRAPEDYIHRVGRTGRAEATGYAFTFVSPEEETELGRIEKVLGKRLPRVTAPDFDYSAAPPPRPEVSHERAPRDRASRPQPSREKAGRSQAEPEPRPARRDGKKTDGAPRDGASRDSAPRDSAPRDPSPRNGAPRDTERQGSSRGPSGANRRRRKKQKEASAEGKPRGEATSNQKADPSSEFGRKNRPATRRLR
ncbi:MAG: DEAD/DEAH box helicase [Candidatus Eisenbacteria bacterium]